MFENEDTGKINIQFEQNDSGDVATEQMEVHTLIASTKSNLIPRLLKSRFLTPLFYIASGLFVFCSLLVIFHTYILRLKVETAVVSAPIEAMVAPVNGYIIDIFVTAGEQVKKGHPLLKIENIDLERELQLARVQTEESKLNVDYYQHLLTNEQQRLKVYQKIGHNRVISAQTLVTMSKQNVMTAQQNLDRFTALLKKHYVSKSEWEAKLSQYVIAQEKLKNAEAQQNVEHHSLKAVDKGMYFTGTKTEGIERDLYAELEAAQKRTKLNESRVKIYENLVEKLTLKAPFDGRVTQILKSAGNTTDNIKPTILIEKASTNKNIIAYLSQDEVVHVNASKNVEIYIPASGKTFRGKVIEINRTDGFIDEVKVQYRWRNFQVDRSAMVTIAIQQSDLPDFNKQSFSGMPAIAYFSKKMTMF